MDNFNTYDWKTELQSFATRHQLELLIIPYYTPLSIVYIYFFKGEHLKTYTLNEAELAGDIKGHIAKIKKELISLWELDPVAVDDICEPLPEPLTVEEIDQCIHKFADEGWLQVEFDGSDYDDWLKHLVNQNFYTASSLRLYCSIFKP